MLLNIDRDADHPQTLTAVTNVYERLVFDHLVKVGGDLSAEAFGPSIWPSRKPSRACSTIRRYRKPAKPEPPKKRQSAAPCAAVPHTRVHSGIAKTGAPDTTIQSRTLPAC